MMLTLKEPCNFCSGTGRVYSTDWWIQSWEGNNPPLDAQQDPCPDCGGSGMRLTADGETVAQLICDIIDERERKVQ